jgi:hypothetical protein
VKVYDTTPTLITTSASSTTSPIYVSGLTGGTVYYFYIIASNPGGTGPETSFNALQFPTYPTPPNNVRVSRGAFPSSAFFVYWNRPTYINGGGDTTRVIGYGSGNGGVQFAVFDSGVITDGSILSYIGDPGFVYSFYFSPYTITVTTTNSAGYSNSASVTIL